MLDSRTPFKIKFFKLYKCNFLQFFSSRFGLGSSITCLVCSFSGIHFKLKILSLVDKNFYTKYTNFYVLKKVYNFLYRNKNFLDENLKKKKFDDIKFLKSIKLLRGRNHSNFLPVRGQRNRTNAGTRSRGRF
jgi:ribosomal protein S13